jgi:hypothetical protein
LGGWTFSGALEGFYEWNFNQPIDRINLLRAYATRANTFALQQVALILERAPKVDRGDRIGLRVPKVTWTVNYYFGQEQRDDGQPEGPNGYFRVFDTYGTYTPTAALSFGLDVNRVSSEVTTSGPKGTLVGLGTYARYQLTTPAAVAFRYERLDDDGGLFGGVQQLLQEATFTGEYKLAEGFLVRAEFRRDWSNRLFFPGDAPGSLRSGQNTALVG